MVSFERFHFLFAHSMRTAVSTYQTFSTDEKPLSILDVRDAKNRRKLAMVTAYDTPSARIVDRAGVDMVLVGDSLGMVMLGRKDTLSVTLDEMIHHCRAVVQGIHHALVVADMPFMTYEPGPDTALSNAARLVRESGVRAVKLEALSCLRSARWWARAYPSWGISATPPAVRAAWRLQGAGQARRSSTAVA